MGLISLLLVRGAAAAPAGPMAVARVETIETTRVNLIHRTVPQNAIIYPTGWEVHHITDGKGTVVTGGRVVRSTGADGEQVATIEDGEGGLSPSATSSLSRSEPRTGTQTSTAR
jgi:hypothetical protein